MGSLLFQWLTYERVLHVPMEIDTVGFLLCVKGFLLTTSGSANSCVCNDRYLSVDKYLTVQRTWRILDS
jgi:hypothetical protein